MRELSACDFCGASDAGTFEVLPPEIDAGEASEASRASPGMPGGGRRMVLCDDCRTTLGGVVQPLLDHLEGGDDVEPDVGDVEPDVGGDAGSEGPGGQSAAAGADANPAGRQGDQPGDGDAAGGSTSADGGASDAGSAETGGAKAGGADAGSAEAGDADAGSASAGRDESGAKMAATGAGKSSGVPRGYRKTVRFLENREFPMPRENAVSMTSDAYGLDEEAVHAAIDHAIKHDRLTEFDGELRKP
jgi:hypothetical protein